MCVEARAQKYNPVGAANVKKVKGCNNHIKCDGKCGECWSQFECRDTGHYKCMHPLTKEKAGRAK